MNTGWKYQELIEEGKIDPNRNITEERRKKREAEIFKSIENGKAKDH